MKSRISREVGFALFPILVVLIGLVLTNIRAGRAAESSLPPAARSSSVGANDATYKGYLPIINSTQNSPTGIDPDLVKRLKQNARGAVSLSTKKSTGVASFVRVGKGGDLLPALQRAEPQGKAIGFFTQFGGVFGVQDAKSELDQISAQTDSLGDTHLSYQQVYNSVPVYAGILRAHLDASGNLTSINGVFVPNINLDTTPSLSSEAAANLAIAIVTAKPPQDANNTDAAVSVSKNDLYVESNSLTVYRDGLVQDVPGEDFLVYQVVVSDGAGVREFVFIDAHTGRLVNRYSGIQEALFRRLFEQNTGNQIWQEGDPFPGTLNQDQQNIVNFSGNAYYHFFNAFGRDAYDGLGHELQSVNNDPRINCPNANWNGLTTNYCNGVTGDDVVAHEWGHAYTEYTDNLIYQWQSGALNESYSDIWGETVDWLNGAGTDSPATVRSDNTCSAYTAPIPLLRVNSPASIAGDYAAGGASFGPPLTAAGVTGNVVLGDDGTGTTSDACEALVNGGAIAGNIALVDRGTCAFTIKVKNAQNAGAVGVIVADNVAGPAAGMGGSDPTITIPSLRVTLDTGNLIKGELGNGVNATLTVFGAGTPEESYRWLMGEDATAFGSAIRDMWAPTCLGDPGKVTDSQYFCATSDGGGVHTNSGVPNHGYALLVDGGSYNGHTVNAIGLVKAAHLYWRAQSVYQTPSTDFADHADALQASCQDLIGVPLEGLSTSSTPAGPSGQAMTGADCAAVDEMIAAVELRTDPSAQCNFQPILKQNPPPLCTDKKNPATLYAEDFEDGLAGWTVTNQGVYSGWPNMDWVQSTALPGGRSGSAAFGPDPLAGDCGAGDGDISGVMYLESPPIHIPNTKTLSPRLTYEHYVATEAGWDGGNLEISINGGPYTLVPASAYLFNPYNMTLQTAAAGNTNPLAGQPAFSGTDGGSLSGSWGQSQIDLTAVGVKMGDTIRLRYELGMDGCNGNDGWYVDDVKVRGCKVK